MLPFRSPGPRDTNYFVMLFGGQAGPAAKPFRLPDDTVLQPDEKPPRKRLPRRLYEEISSWLCCSVHRVSRQGDIGRRVGLAPAQVVRIEYLRVRRAGWLRRALRHGF